MLSPRASSQSTLAAAADEICTPYGAHTSSKKIFATERKTSATWQMKSMRAVFSSTKYVFFDPYIYCQNNKAYKKHAASALVLHMNGIYEAGPGQLKEKTFIAVGIKKSRADGSDKIERKVFIELACTTWGQAPTPETYFIADVADIPDKNFTLQIERNPTTGAFGITMDGKNIMPNNVNADLLANLKNTQTTKFTSGTFMVELHDIRSHAPGMESSWSESAYIVTDVMYKRDTDSLLWRRIADKEAEENNNRIAAISHI